MDNEPIFLIEENKKTPKNKKRLAFVLGCGVSLILCIGVFVLNGIVIIRSDQRGVVISALEPNGYRAEPLEPGIHWISPFLEAVQNYSVAPQTYTMSSSGTQGDDSIQSQTKDGKQVFINASVTYAIDPAQLIKLHITWQNRYEENVVRPVTRAAIHDVFHQYNTTEINGEKREVIQKLIEEKIKQLLMDNSLILLDFTIQAVRIN